MENKYAPPMRGDHEFHLREGIKELRDIQIGIQARTIARFNYSNLRSPRRRRAEVMRQTARFLEFEAVIKKLEKSLERHLEGKRYWEK